MKEGNGIWRAVALTSLAALQALCFWTLTEIKTDIKTIRDDEQKLGKTVTAQQVQLAAIINRHTIEDSKTSKTP